MRSVLVILLSFVFVIFLVNLNSRREANLKKPSLPPSPQVNTSNLVTNYGDEEVSLKVGDYLVSWLKIDEVSKVKLFSNLKENLASKVLKEKYNCKYLVSAGFYSEEGGLIGLFISEGKKLSSYQKNQTFDGFFQISQESKPTIGRIFLKNPRLALQSGPILLEDRKPLKLSLKNDEDARRIVIVKTDNDEIVFIAFYKDNSVLLGPKLSLLPNLVIEFDSMTKLDITEALNLDGGSHSAFLSDEINLQEVSSIGSFFCITP